MGAPTFILLHGAWHGGWCYSRVARLLRSKGYDVLTPTLTGLGERSHLATPAINASTHVQDILNIVSFESLDDIVLVGHSYGGQIITAVADAIPDKIRSLVYLDAFVGEHGRSIFDMDSPAATAAYVDMAQSNGGYTVPPLPSAVFGVNNADQAWVDQRCTPGSLATWTERLSLTGCHKLITNRSYVFATGWNGPFRPIYERVRAEGGWRTYEFECGHDVMIDMPRETADVIELSAIDVRARASSTFFPGFRQLEVEAGDVQFAGTIGGSGPPVLLLHGYPQTHIAWRRVAPALAEHHTVIIPDLPGYGSSRPHDMAPRWTKRRIGDAFAALMDRLGHDRFAVVGHDRGARVGYRLALDHPKRVTAFASLAVVPTLDAMAAIDYRSASRAFHWFLFSQEADLPERLLAADPDAFIDRALAGMTGGRDVIEPAALDAYRIAFRDPRVRHAICEDYRAAMNEDLALDVADRAAGRSMSCPVLVLWPRESELPGRPTPVETWGSWANDVVGVATGGGHLQPEEAPDEVLASVRPFLAGHAAGIYSV